MYQTFFHDLLKNKNWSEKMERIPTVGETISFSCNGSFYVVRGITQNKFHDAAYAFDIYLSEIVQLEWVQSMR